MADAPPAEWRYPHQDFDEPALPDQTRIVRPAVLVAPAGSPSRYLGVVDSGSPLSVADPAFLEECGVELASTEPVMTVPFRLAGHFSDVAFFTVQLELLHPSTPALRTPWTAQVGAPPR